MKKRLFKLASIVLCLAILFTSVTVMVSAEAVYTVVGGTTGEVKNPVYEDVDTSDLASYSATTKKYLSSQQDQYFDINLCTANQNEVVSDIRENMVDRETAIDIYYKDGSTYHNDNNAFIALINNWFELTFAETENSFEGDYLRYAYGGYNSFIWTQYIEGQGIYYHHIKINLSYYTTKAEENILDAKIDEVIEDFNFSSTTTDKIKSDIIYSYITENVSYDYEHLNDYSYKYQFTAYAALINGTAVCQGYATLFYRIARECGLSTRVVVGTSRGENHAWNIVKIDDKYYYVDSTWDAGGSISYYLKGSDSFTNNHTPEPQFLSSEFISKYPISNSDYNNEVITGLREGDFEYKVNMSKAVITKYLGEDKDLVIPNTIGGYPVDRLGQHAIRYDNHIETITFSEGITGMDEEALSSCYSLKQINFPSTFSIDYEKFEDMVLGGYSTVPDFCDALETVTLADGNKKMKLVDGILYSYDMTCVIFCPAKYAKTKVVLPDTVVTVVSSAFKDCVNIEEIVMPNSVKMIGYWAFMNANSLEKADIPSGCEVIGQFAYGGTKVSSLNIPASVRLIMGGAFGANCKLKTITVDPENKYFFMYGSAFCAKSSDSDDVVMLDYATGDEATSYTIPEVITVLEQYALAHADNLKEIIVPATVKEIYAYAFESCANLEHIEFEEGIEAFPYGALLYCNNLASVILPSSMTTINETGFVGIDRDQFTIYGESGSRAQTYAEENGINFKPVSQFICTDGHNMQKQVYSNYYQYVCENCGDKSLVHWRVDIASVAYYGKTEQETYIYNGEKIEPKIKSVSNGDRELKEGVDYIIVGYLYNDGPGWGSVVIEGIGDYYGRGEIQFQIIDPLPATEMLSAALYGYNDVKIAWRQVEGADGYCVYYKKSSSSSYTYKGTTTGLSYKFADLSENTSYTFKVSAYFNDGTNKEVSYKHKTVTITTLRDLKAPSKVSLSLYGYDDVKVSWSKVSYANGYYVYYKKSTSKSYTYAGKTTGTSFNKANLYDGIKYDFKVVPYGVSGGKVILDDSYKTASIYTLKQLATPKITKYSSKSVKVYWNNINGESGYQISRSTKKSGTSIVSTVYTTTGKTKVVSATKDKGYYYKVRAFKKVGSKTVYGPWSTAKYYKFK